MSNLTARRENAAIILTNQQSLQISCVSTHILLLATGTEGEDVQIECQYSVRTWWQETVHCINNLNCFVSDNKLFIIYYEQW